MVIMKKIITKDDVKHISDLARINLTEKELMKFSSEFVEILDAFRIIDEVDVKDVEPSFHPLNIRNVFRDDNVKIFSADDILSNAKKKEKGFILGPKVG